jgi:AcrR family transcriptional regulator
MAPSARKKRWSDEAPDPDKRMAILDAALQLFAVRGFHGTAVPLIAEQAGVGAGTLYRYFASKEALVNVVYRHWKGRLTHEMLKDFPLDAPAREQFSVFFRRMVAFAAAHRDAFTFLELQHHAPYLDAESREQENAALLLMRSFIERAQDTHEVSDVAPEIIISLVYGAVVGLVKAAQHAYFKMEKRVIDDAEHLMWEAVRHRGRR